MIDQNSALELYKQELYYGEDVADIGYILPDGNFIDITKTRDSKPVNIIRHGDELLQIDSLKVINPDKLVFYTDKLCCKYNWIECNKKVLNHQLVRLPINEPTEIQYLALKKFIDCCLDNGFIRVGSLYNSDSYQVYVLFYNKYLEPGYEVNEHLTADYVINKIKKYYQTRVLDSEQSYYNNVVKQAIRVNKNKV